MWSKGCFTVLDLPQLYTRPSSTALTSSLELLALKPLPWGSTSQEAPGEGQRQVSEEGVPKYLTSIVASQLDWIDEEKREHVWETASKRLSERSGRTAIPSVSRTFLIPNPSTGSTVSITLCEPSLTADNLGHKTWLASYLLAKRLPYLIPYIPCLSNATAPGHSGTALFSPTGPHILELGAGTGLLGIAAATLFPSATIHLTDLPAIIPNLQANVSHSIVPDFQSSGTQRITVGALDWSKIADEEGQPMSENPSHSSFDIVLAADPLYSPLHPAWLVDAITGYLKRTKEARAIVELPLRECYEAEMHDFLARMADRGLELIEEGEEVGTEDWEDLRGEEERAMVKCWWGIWRWEKSPK